jgi:hypothetical protein
MPYDYNSTSSLAHARNFKYIKREPDGKGGWRYYYDVKSHGANIKRNIENKTGITARNKMNAAKDNYDYKKWRSDNKKEEASKAKKEYEFWMKARKDVRDRQKAGEKVMFVGSGPDHQKDGEAYRDANIAADKASKQATSAKKEYEKAKKEYENEPLVKLSKEVKAGADRIATWFDNKVDEVKEKTGHAALERRNAAEDKMYETKWAKESADYKFNRDRTRENGEAYRDAQKAFEKSTADYNKAMAEYNQTDLARFERDVSSFNNKVKRKGLEINDTIDNKVNETALKTIEKAAETADKLGVDEQAYVKGRYSDLSDAKRKYELAVKNYKSTLNNGHRTETTHLREQDLKNATAEYDAKLTEFNKAREEYLNTPIGKADKFREDAQAAGYDFVSSMFKKKKK